MKIFVGLSGGVDSAVSAALLTRAGHEVVGAFIKIWSPEFLECTWREDRIDAMRVAVALGIPFREIDLSQDYMREVVGDMIEKYQSGITPNPDVLCNRFIKFGAFKAWALAEGAEKIATGHYARCGQRSDVHTLLRSPDPGKDQSYFLYRMTQDDLAHAVFPVGGMYKREVRALAQEFDLPVSKKHDSQGLCFVGDVSIPEFLSRYIDLKRGPVVDTAGREIGEHDGVALYTVGQRHGFRTTTNTPHYVVSGDIGSNTLVVSAEKADTLSRSATLSDVHWIGETPGEGETLEAQTRYHAAIAHATLTPKGADWQVAFDKPELLSPGQSVVLYRGDECVGGGVVEKTTRN
jgi:tRNA-specific 2-thiouridylase